MQVAVRARARRQAAATAPDDQLDYSRPRAADGARGSRPGEPMTPTRSTPLPTALEILEKRVAELHDKKVSLRKGQESLLSHGELNARDVGRGRQLVADLAAVNVDLAEAEENLAAERASEARSALFARSAAELGHHAVGGGPRGSYGNGVTGERRTYDRGTAAEQGHSFFADLVGAEHGDYEARDRIQRHRQEVDVDGRGMNYRAASTGSFAGLVPPAYLIDLVAPVLRSGRPAANAMRHRDLPPTGLTAIVPRGSTGASVAVQASENTALSSTDETWANITVPIITVAGQQDVSRQSLDRGLQVDTQIMEDLLGAWAAQMDTQVLVGTGTGGQMLGLFNTPGVNQATAYGAAVTVTTFASKFAGAVGAIAATGATVRPRLALMSPRRWAWLNAQVDSQGRPLVVPGIAGPMNAAAVNSNPGA